MARNRGRKPSDAPLPSPDERAAAAGGALGSANGSVSVAPTGQRVVPPGASPAASTPAAAVASSSSTSAAGDGASNAAATGSSTSAAGDGASKEPAGAAGGQPPRPGPGTPPGGAPGGRPGIPPAGGTGASGRPPGVGGGPGAGRAPGGAPPAGGGSHRSLRNGLIGGVIGGAAAALAVVWFLPRDDAELQALRTQVEQLEGALADGTGGQPAVAELGSRIEALEQAAPPGIDPELQARLEALEQAAPAAPDGELQARVEALEQGAPDVAGLAQRVEALESSLAEGASPGDVDQRLNALQEDLAALSANVGAQAQGAGDAPASDRAALESLQSRLAALEERGGQAADQAALAALQTRLEQVEGSLPDAGAAADVALRLDTLAARLDTIQPLAERSASEQAALSSGLQGLEEQIRGLREQAEATRTEIGALTQRLDQTEAGIAAADDQRERAALLALLTSQIDGAISQSRPYEAPLQSLSALDGADGVVSEAAAALAPTAAAGVPSLAALRRGFEEVAGEIVHRAQAPDGDGLLDQAAGNLMRLVSVRPVGGDVAGEGAPARVARAEARLAEGDLVAAVAEIEALEGPPAEAAAGWLAAANSRLAATDALGRLQSRATELLSETQ